MITKDTEDIVCYSQAASVAIHKLTMEDEAVVSCSSSAIHLGGRAIDRCNPIIRDASRFGKVVLQQPPATTTSRPPPCDDKLPAMNAKQYPNKKYHNQNSNNIPHHQKKNTIMVASSSSMKSKGRSDYQKSSEISSADSAEKTINKTPASAGREIFVENDNKMNISSIAGGGSSSSRYLLSSRHFEPLISMVEPSPPPANYYSQPTSPVASSCSSSSPAASAAGNQVVVLRVSLHCKGCERKMRKHISKMDGVKSFDIDFAAKKLTVVGEVTPLSVLASVSKVKKAQLLTTPLSTASDNIPISATRKDKAILV